MPSRMTGRLASAIPPTASSACTSCIGNVVILTQPVDTGAKFDDVIASMQ